jgi:hypothetical protein
MQSAGWAAIAGSVTALLMTPPFATAYFLAYPGEDPFPFWYDAVRPRLDPLLTFASSERVYATYGRIYNLVYLLFIPVVAGVHRAHSSSPSRLEKRGHAMLMCGLIATTLGVAGDYWGDGIGFGVEVLGLLSMIVGVSVWGIALVRGKVVPALWAWLMVICGPAAIASLALIGHLPSGPTMSFAIVWLVVGCLMLSDRSTTAPAADAIAAPRRRDGNDPGRANLRGYYTIPVGPVSGQTRSRR